MDISKSPSTVLSYGKFSSQIVGGLSAGFPPGIAQFFGKCGCPCSREREPLWGKPEFTRVVSSYGD